MTYKLFAPKCAYPTCNNLVGYHKRYPKVDGTRGYRWKNACEEHRGQKKHEFDKWKLELGCENSDARYGFKCTSTISRPAQIDIHHKDGNRYNTSENNLERICRNCHSRVTIENGDHLNRYTVTTYLNPKLFEI
jgi:hypothetical protein